MHASLQPSTACSRFSPPRASHPAPGWRLLQALAGSWKYAQRVRCSRLPPTVAALRNCAEAPDSSASATAG